MIKSDYRSAMPSVCAIIPAAGKGSRAGSPKLFLKYQDNFFLSTIVNTLLKARVDAICCVTAPGLDLSSFHSLPSVHWITNNSPSEGMISSVFLGVQSMPGRAGYLIWPVDHPAVRCATITALIDHFHQASADVFKPVYQGQGGHPVLLSAEMAWRIPAGGYPGGLHRLLIEKRAKTELVSTEDRGILVNVNTKSVLKDLGISADQVNDDLIV